MFELFQQLVAIVVCVTRLRVQFVHFSTSSPSFVSSFVRFFMHHSSPFCPISLLLRLLELSSPSCLRAAACPLFSLLKASFHFFGCLPASCLFLSSQELRPRRQAHPQILRHTQQELRSLRAQHRLQELLVRQRSRR